MRKLAYVSDVQLTDKLEALLKAAGVPLMGTKFKFTPKVVTESKMPWPPPRIAKPAKGLGKGFSKNLNPGGKLISAPPPEGRDHYGRMN